VGAAVISLPHTLWAKPLPPSTSAPLAVLIALTKALQLSQGKSANIYTDSKYACLVLHAHVALWKEQGFLTTTGSPIKHSRAILDLLRGSPTPKAGGSNSLPWAPMIWG
jgi:hypothetical protein